VRGLGVFDASRQIVEQRLGVLKDRHVEAFGEPAVDRCEEIAGFGALAQELRELLRSRHAPCPPVSSEERQVCRDDAEHC
jgi:hypothetical protein